MMRSIPVAMITLAIASCSPARDADPLAVHLWDVDAVFLVQSERPDVVMEALVHAPVTRDDRGCLRLDSADRHTVIWPRGFTLEPSGVELRVLDETGAEVGRIGGSFRLGGGEVAELHDGIPVSSAVRERAVQSCPGRYWIVGEVPRA